MLRFRTVCNQMIPVYFSQPAVYARQLTDKPWSGQSELVGIDMKESRQLELLAGFSSVFKNEYELIPRKKTDSPRQYYVTNTTFGSVDGEVLYCMLRNLKPKRMMEIGSGNSTLLSAQALRKNTEERSPCEFIAIEPYPNSLLQSGVPGLTRLIEEKVQDVPIVEFLKLGDNDVLFIDSSHALQIGSDVQYEYLEIIPRLKKGVIIHAHDIFLPAEYHRAWVKNDYRYLFWTEQYLLQAFLAFNDSFEVLWGSSFMHLRHPDRLEHAFSSYERTAKWPGSFWIRKLR
jgi:predicted O-methyltransferase YrrM